MSLSYRWIIVAAGALMSCVAIGTMFSLAIFLEPMALDTNWSRAGISSAMTLNFLVMGLGGFAWGAISDRFGARIVVLIGAALLGLALVLASRAGSLLSFQLTYGVLVGLAASAFFAPMIALTTAWFDTNRSLAVSLVSAGMGVAPMTISPFARWLISSYDWRTAMFDIGIMAWVLLLPAVLLVRQPPRPISADTTSTPVAEGAGMTVAQALRSPQFIVLGLTFLACCAAHSGPIFHMVSYAMLCGVAPMAAVSIYSVEGLAGLGGRLLYGVLADRLGVKPVLISGLAIQAIVIATYLSISHLWRRDAALCGAGARIFRAAHAWHGVRRRHHAVQPRHGLRPSGRRHGVRCLCQLFLAVHRLGHYRAWRGRDRNRLPATTAQAASTGIEAPEDGRLGSSIGRRVCQL
jgi:MFS family permease